MITDYALRLSEDQELLTGTAATQHAIDLLQARNFALGEPLYAVVSITTTYDASSTDDPKIQWVIYQSISDAKTDAVYAHVLGASKVYSCNANASIPRNLQKGQRITIPLAPITMHATSTADLTSLLNPDTAEGKRYVYGVTSVTGGFNFTAGKFTIDICTQAMLGGTASTADISIYPKSYTVQ